MPWTLLWCVSVTCGAFGAAAPRQPTLLPVEEDECSSLSSDRHECALSALQRRAARVSSDSSRASSPGRLPEAPPDGRSAEPRGPVAKDDELAALLSEGVGVNVALVEDEVREIDMKMGRLKLSPINLFNDRLDSWKARGKGTYYEFRTSQSELVFSGQVEGRLGSFSDMKTPFPLASASKLFTAFACMRTMQLKPMDWYPTKAIHRFKGWENFKNFPVHGSTKKSNLNIHHLLTHTSGLPFAMRVSKEEIANQTLFYEPGTRFGYTLGHRVVGWLLRDYWRAQPETKQIHIRTVQDTFKWLIFDKLGLSPQTKFSTEMTHLFGYEGGAGDASIQSTGEDLMKLAVVALRKGRLPSGREMISERNWDRWAVPNLLPGGRPSKDLVAWQGADASWLNWNIGDVKEQIMKQSGDYGWNYFGATYNSSKEIGWCGFFSSCLRVTYPNDLAFVMMQRDVADLKKSKPLLNAYFGRMAKSLQCHGKSCIKTCRHLSFLPWCRPKKQPTVSCEINGKALAWTRSCPINTTRGKAWHKDTELDEKHYTCYVPRCSR